MKMEKRGCSVALFYKLVDGTDQNNDSYFASEP